MSTPLRILDVLISVRHCMSNDSRLRVYKPTLLRLAKILTKYDKVSRHRVHVASTRIVPVARVMMAMYPQYWPPGVRGGVRGQYKGPRAPKAPLT